MQTSEHDYKGASAALDEAYDNFAFSECVTGEQFRTIKRALLIAERLMQEPSEGMIMTACNKHKPFTDVYPCAHQESALYRFKAMRAKLIEEIDHAEG